MTSRLAARCTAAVETPQFSQRGQRTNDVTAVLGLKTTLLRKPLLPAVDYTASINTMTHNVDNAQIGLPEALNTGQPRPHY